MIKTLKESQLNNRAWIPYGRLISEIFNQGGLLRGLSETRGFTDDMLGTVTGKIINGGTLANMKLIKPEAIIKLETDLKESRIFSNLMEGFPLFANKIPWMFNYSTFMITCKAQEKKSVWKTFLKPCLVAMSKWPM